MRLAGRYDVEMPIVTLVDDIVNRGADAAETAAKLMGRRKKPNCPAARRNTILQAPRGGDPQLEQQDQT